MSSTSRQSNQPQKLSLLAAILININIMIGSGIFVNTVLLASLSGIWGAAVYGVVGLLILPLIFTLSQLLDYHDGGTFYEFGSELAPVWGFAASWTYFVGKLASSALGIHVFVTLIQELVPALGIISPLMFDIAIIALFTTLNMYNVTTGSKVNYIFVFLKSIPILFVVIAALLFWNPSNIAYETISLQAFTCCIPFVIFSFMGFEASCSLSQSIENPKKNGPRAIIISYAITLATVIAYQLGFFVLIGTQLGILSRFYHPFLQLINDIFPKSLAGQTIATVCTLSGIAASSLGSSYAIMYSNVWNLYTLAQKKHLLGHQLLTQKNSYNTPFVSVFITGLIVMGYIITTRGFQVPLQQISSAGATIAYTISTLSLVKIAFFTLKNHRLLAILSSLSCGIFLYTLGANAQIFGALPLMLLGLMSLGGIGMFYATKRKATQS